MTRQERNNIAPPLRDLILDAAVGHFVVPSLQFSKVVGGQWSEHSIAAYDTSLELKNGELSLHVRLGWDELDSLHRLMDTKNQSMLIELADESRIESELANLSTATNGHAPVRLYHWTWRSRTLPRWWIGNLEGVFPAIGNLSLRANGANGSSKMRFGWLLEGRYRWFLLPKESTDGQNVVLLEPTEEPVEHEGVRADLMAMQFAFGSSVTLTHLVGLDSARTPVGGISAAQFARGIKKGRAPVPDFLEDGEAWPPELFRLLSQKLHAEGIERLTIAIAAYLDSQSDHLDGAYLKAHVGLEAFAKRVVTKTTPDLLVHDKEKWIAWARSLAPQMGGHLKDVSKLEMIIGKFISAGFAPTGDLVEKAMGSAEISLPPDVVKEIANRNYPAHGFFMNKGMQYEVLRDARRLEMIQTLLAALVAVHVGFHGPLRGYDVTDNGARPSPSWWPVTWKVDDVLRLHVAEGVVDGGRLARTDQLEHSVIATAAYFRWVARGQGHGCDLDDWLAVEMELKTRGNPSEDIQWP